MFILLASARKEPIQPIPLLKIISLSQPHRPTRKQTGKPYRDDLRQPLSRRHLDALLNRALGRGNASWTVSIQGVECIMLFQRSHQQPLVHGSEAFCTATTLRSSERIRTIHTARNYSVPKDQCSLAGTELGTESLVKRAKLCKI